MGDTGNQGSAEGRGHVTMLLVNWTEGDQAAMAELMPLVYEELRRLAGRQMAGEREGHLLQPTALVNEAFLRLVAIENLVFASAWQAAGKKGSPTFHGQPYVLLTDKPETKVDEAHGWEPHYELHLWLFRDNPNGIYSEFSPRVTCEHNKPPQPPPAAMAH